MAANRPVNVRLDPYLIQRLDALRSREAARTGIKPERPAVLRAALVAYLDAAEEREK